MARPATAFTFRSGRSRSSQSRSLMNDMPWFWPRPAMLKPVMVMQDSTASFCSTRKWFRSCVITASVCSRVDPGGSWTMAIIIPWSSSGRYDVGIRMK